MSTLRNKIKTLHYNNSAKVDTVPPHPTHPPTPPTPYMVLQLVIYIFVQKIQFLIK
jgi:hypothetical protein